MINKIFSLSQNVRYVAIYRNGKLKRDLRKEPRAPMVRNQIDIRSCSLTLHLSHWRHKGAILTAEAWNT